MNVKQIIRDLYSKSISANKSLAANALFSIIQIKTENPEFLKLEESLFLDITKFIDSYIDSVAKKDFGYNSIAISKIRKAINLNPDYEEKVKLYDKAIRKLKDCGFPKESERLKASIKKVYINSLFKSHKIKDFFKAIICCMFYNPLTVSAIMILFFLSYMAITMLLSSNPNSLFRLDYNYYCDCFLLNHVLNIFGDLLEYNKHRFCNPNNIWGIAIALTYKSLLVVYAGWFLKECSKRIQLNLTDYECDY